MYTAAAVTVFFAVSLNVARSAPTVRILSALPSPQAVGTVVGLTAIPKEEGDPLTVLDKLRFRYSVSVEGGRFHVIRDFSRNPSFAWRPELYEHDADIRVAVENTETEQTGEADLQFQVVSRVRGEQPIVTPTAHPLVALFSSAPCPEGSQFRVAYKREGDAADSRTGSEPCRGSRTSNIYVAGMRADSLYAMRPEVVTGQQVRRGPSVPFHTGIIDGRLGPLKVTNPGQQKTISRESLLIFSMEEPITRPIATDLDGNVVWYLPEAECSLTRMLSGGRFLVLRAGGNDENSQLQLLSEVDLAGNILRETNITRVAEQFKAHGIESVCRPNGQQCIPGFHHDAIRLPNGHTLAIASLERMFPGGSQGSKEPTDVLGVLLVDLDADLQLQWHWNAFDHLDVKRAALGDEKCKAPLEEVVALRFFSLPRRTIGCTVTPLLTAGLTVTSCSRFRSRTG
jgi:arylsulfate sulfotransferase